MICLLWARYPQGPIVDKPAFVGWHVKGLLIFLVQFQRTGFPDKDSLSNRPVSLML